MSQEGLLILMTPRALSQVCEGWPVECQIDLPTGVKSIEQALVFFKRAPLCLELSMPSSMRWVLENGILRAIGYRDEDNENDTDPLECPCFLYELAEEDFERSFSGIVGKYKDKSTRGADGIRPYWLLWSY